MNPAFIMWIENLIEALLGLSFRPAVCCVITGKKPTLAEVVNRIPRVVLRRYNLLCCATPPGGCTGGLAAGQQILFFTNWGSDFCPGT